MVDIYTDEGVGSEVKESQSVKPIYSEEFVKPAQETATSQTWLNSSREKESNFGELPQVGIETIPQIEQVQSGTLNQVAKTPMQAQLEKAGISNLNRPHDFSQAINGYKKPLLTGSGIVLKVGVSLLVLSIVASVLYLVFT